MSTPETPHVVTVGELVKELEQYHPDWKVRIASSSMHPGAIIMSIYDDRSGKVVWIDISAEGQLL